MKLFLAGADSQQNCGLFFMANNSNYLTTFYVFQNGTPSGWLEWYNHTKKLGASWIMDSGLFTMMFGAGSGKTYTEEDLTKYTHHYLESLKKIGYNDYIVEMDVHKVLGIDALKIFRKIFEKNYPIEKTIYVWHIEEGQKGFDELCKKYPYIAISIPELRFVLKRKSLKNAVKHLIQRANKINPNIKIHLLGCTQQNLMEQSGYYSCDSTSWQSGVRYGNNAVFINKKIKAVSVHTQSWEHYKKTQEHKYVSSRATIPKTMDTEPYYKNPDYWQKVLIAAKAYIKLNKHINDKYFGHEEVKKLY